uniref:Protein kinase domain-containing protein n=1 Tax=Aegilops tauschii subsp. strangulata TaxID=200361 RepID=A0A453T889_AEGTS
MLLDETLIVIAKEQTRGSIIARLPSSSCSLSLCHEEEDHRSSQISLVGENSSMDFKLQLLEAITDNFSEEQKLGSGDYGEVYRAVLDNGEYIALKKLHQLQGLDDKQFRSGFRDLVRVSHKNVVRLIGYCHESRKKYVEHKGELTLAKITERVLCFEYMHGGSFDKHIADESCELDWPICYKIIKGTCEGLNHLHTKQEKPIFHLDLKPSNILLDESMTPKISDLGLSILVSSTKTHETEILRGTQ